MEKTHAKSREIIKHKSQIQFANCKLHLTPVLCWFNPPLVAIIKYLSGLVISVASAKKKKKRKKKIQISDNNRKNFSDSIKSITHFENLCWRCYIHRRNRPTLNARDRPQRFLHRSKIRKTKSNQIKSNQKRIGK